MQSLQDILDNFNSSKLAKLPEGKLRQTMVGINLYENREKSEDKRKESIRNSIAVKENCRNQFLIRGHKLIEAGKEYSQKKVTCPHCNTVGPQGNMIKFHMDKCKRTAGFSDDKIYELHLQGLKNFEICKLSGLKRDTLSRIIIKYKNKLL